MPEKRKGLPWTTISMIVIVVMGMVVWLNVASNASSNALDNDAVKEAADAAGVPSGKVRGPRDVIDSVRDTVKAARKRLDTPH